MAISTNGFHGEIEDSFFRGVHKKVFGLYCNEREPDSAINEIWKNVGVFHCSTESDPEKFCSCVSKSVSNTDQKLIEQKTNEIETKLKESIRRELSDEKSFVQSARLRHLDRLRKMDNIKTRACINEGNISNHGSDIGKTLLRDDQDYLTEKLVNNSLLVDDDFDKLLQMAKAAQTYKTAQNIVFSVSLGISYFEKISDVSRMVIQNEVSKSSAGYVYPSEKDDTRFCGTDFKEVREIDVNILEKFIEYKNSDNYKGISDSAILKDALDDVVTMECNKLTEELVEMVDADGNEIADAVIESKADSIYQSYATKPDELVRGLHLSREEELLRLGSTGDKNEIDRLEIKYFYDIAFCKLSNQLKTTAKEVAQRIKGGGEDLAEMQGSLMNIEDNISSISKDVQRTRSELNHLKD